MDEERKTLFEKEVNWQQVIAMRLNHAWNIRQDKPKKFKHGVAGAWNSLWPELKSDLSKKIGDGKRNEKYFDELVEQVREIDFAEEFDEEESEEEIIIRCCEYISGKILEVLSNNNLLYGYRSETHGVMGIE